MTSSGWQAFATLLGGAEYRLGLITTGSPVHRVEFAPGLTDAEVETVEDRFDFRFPADLPRVPSDGTTPRPRVPRLALR